MAGESLTYSTVGFFGSVRSPIGVSTLMFVGWATHPPGAVWHVSAFSTTEMLLFCASTRSGAGSVAVQPGAPAARVTLPVPSVERFDQQANVRARDRAPSDESAMLATTVCDAIAFAGSTFFARRLA